MAVSLRLTRMGSKKRPFYRIIAIDSRDKRDGQYIELLGTHDVLKDETKVDKEIALKWLNNGAQPSDTVRDILSKAGVMKEFADSKSKKSPAKKPPAKKPTAKK